jgi:antitoxin FitA
MAQLVIRKLDTETKERLRRRAARRGHSMEQEVRDILCAALANDGGAQAVGVGTRISRRFAGLGLAEEMPELRGQSARPADFGE